MAIPADAEPEIGLHAAGLTQVSEVSEDGSVGSLRVSHQGKRALLLVDGEHVAGGKQNRIFNSSLVIPAGATVTVRVSCVEHGRWRYQSHRHQASETTVNSFTRSAKLRRVADSVARGRGTDADQHAVWDDVDQFLCCSRTESRTGAFSDAFDQRREVADQQLRELSPQPGQVGIAAVCEGRLLSMDVFGSPALFSRGFAKIGRGLLAEVYQPGKPSRQAVAVVKRAIKALGAAREAEVHTDQTPGCSPTLHGRVKGAVFGAATHGDVVYHAMVTAA